MKLRYHLLLLLLVAGILLSGSALARQDSLLTAVDSILQRIDHTRIANYTMEVRLDVATKTISGQMELSWTNAARLPAADLRFHLYYNAWRNDKSAFLNSVRYHDRSGWNDYRDDEWAYCEVSSMKILGDTLFPEVEVSSALEYIQPNDGNEFDRTVLRLPLRRPVFPGETIRLALTWETKVPRTFARTGAIGDYFFLAQWFPKIGVFEPEGLWNCQQYIQTEYYADFGTYDVKLTVPRGWVVGATGREIARSDNPDSSTTHQYYQERVHDFTWVTTPHFQEFHQTFESPGLPPVDMRLLLMPDHLDKKERYLESTAAALKYYGSWFGPYPYGHVTVIDPAYQSGSGGMEYPTLFTGGTRWLSPPGTYSPESVTIHEAGHQFWYGIIANNEFDHAWMDEGFNSYAQQRVLRECYPPRELSKRYLEGFLPYVFSGVEILSRTGGADPYGGFYSDFKRDPMAVPSWRYGPGGYRLNSYNKPALMLQTLENYLGWETFQKVLSTYFQRWQFRHPRPADFFAVVNEVSGRDMKWFFDQAYGSADLFDYGVGEVNSKASQPLKGYWQSNGERQFFDGSGNGTAETSSFLNEAYIRRWGEAIFPVEVQLIFANGDTLLESWDGRERWKVFRYIRPDRLVKVTVDPDHKLMLDVNYANNSWVNKPQRNAAAFKWASKWMVWLQNLLEFMAFFS